MKTTRNVQCRHAEWKTNQLSKALGVLLAYLVTFKNEIQHVCALDRPPYPDPTRVPT